MLFKLPKLSKVGKLHEFFDFIVAHTIYIVIMGDISIF